MFIPIFVLRVAADTIPLLSGVIRRGAPETLPLTLPVSVPGILHAVRK